MNRGGGAGGTTTYSGGIVSGFAGGSGVVIISFPTGSISPTSTGSPVITTSGGNTIYQYNNSGSFTF